MGCGRGFCGDVGAKYQASASGEVFPVQRASENWNATRPNRIHLNAAINVFAKARRMKLVDSDQGRVIFTSVKMCRYGSEINDIERATEKRD